MQQTVKTTSQLLESYKNPIFSKKKIGMSVFYPADFWLTKFDDGLC